MQAADVPTGELPAGTGLVFTLFWPEENRWENIDYQVTVNLVI